jgi:hypothetical protein
MPLQRNLRSGPDGFLQSIGFLALRRSGSPLLADNANFTLFD